MAKSPSERDDEAACRGKFLYFRDCLSHVLGLRPEFPSFPPNGYLLLLT